MNKTPLPQPNESGEQTGHTPGPWFVNKYRAAIQAADPSTPHTSNRPICYLELPNRIMPRATDADARLIAAAPELLKALRWYATAQYPDDGSGRPPDSYRRIAKEAIAKAEGVPGSEVHASQTPSDTRKNK